MKIFLSYRRADTADVCGRIYDHLEHHYGPDSVYKDVESMRGGVDFRAAIEQAIRSSDLLICVLGKHWRGVHRTAFGRRSARIDNTADFVRSELELADHFHTPVLPVLVDGAEMPKRDELPVSIQFLLFQNAIPVRHDPDFRRDMQRVIASADALALAAKNLEQLRQEQSEQEKLVELGRERLAELQHEEERRKQQHVLVVDDERVIADAIGAIIEDAGYSVLLASDGAEALRILQSTNESFVVFIDRMMPRMDGLAVIQAVDADPALRNRHSFVLMTASRLGLEGQQDRFGFVILEKPFDASDIERVVELEHTLADARIKLQNLRKP